MDDEEARSGGYRRLYPTAEGHLHRHIFAQERPVNTLLVDVLRRRLADELAGDDETHLNLDSIANAPDDNPLGTTVPAASAPPPQQRDTPSAALPTHPCGKGGGVLLPSELQFASTLRAEMMAASHPSHAPSHPPSTGHAARSATALLHLGGSLPSSRPASVRSATSTVKTSPRLMPASKKGGPYQSHQHFPCAAAALAPAAQVARAVLSSQASAPLPGGSGLLTGQPTRPASTHGRLLDGGGGGAGGGRTHLLAPSSAGAVGTAGRMLPR